MTECYAIWPATSQSHRSYCAR